MEILGNGLIARQFAEMSSEFSPENILIFASGVSNSNESRESEYRRELSCLTSHLESDRRIVYFSTCSILDPSRHSSRYVKHKIYIENLLKARGNSLIVRLPQVVGLYPNSTTLVESLYLRLVSGQPINVHENARRILVDVEDVARIVGILLSRIEAETCTFSIYSDHYLTPLDIIYVLEEITGLSANYTISKSGSFACVDTSILKNILGQSDPIFAAYYGKDVLKRYYKDRLKPS